MTWSPTPVASTLSCQSDQADTAFQHAETVRASHIRGSGILEGLSLAGPRLSHNFRGAIQTLLTCSTRLLTFVSSRQRVSLLGGWLAVALGRTFTFWITSTDFIEAASLESQRLRI